MSRGSAPVKKVGASEESVSPGLQGPLGRWIGRIHRFFAEDVWSAEVDGASLPKRALYRLARLIYLVVHGFRVDRCGFQAATLTYITVLSLVPMLAFAFSLFKGLGAYDELRVDVVDAFLDETMGDAAEDPDAPIATLRTSLDEILDFVSETDFGGLGAIGFLVLLYALLKMIGTVERAFNDIWGVHRARTYVRKLADYVSISVITPFLLLLAATLTAAVRENSIVLGLERQRFLGPFLQTVFGFLPVVAVWIGFSMLYLVLPNTRTRIVSSLLGGLLGGGIWHLAQIGHVEFQIGMANYNKVYSSFAAIPIFLVWVQVSWMTVMIGAEMAYAHQNEPAYRRIARERGTDRGFRQFQTLRASVRIASHFAAGRPPWSASELAEELGVPQATLEGGLAELVKTGILAETGERTDRCYLLSRDPGTIHLKDLLDALRGRAVAASLPAASEEAELDLRLADALQELDEGLAGTPANVSLVELVRTKPAPEPERGPSPGGGEAAPPSEHPSPA